MCACAHVYRYVFVQIIAVCARIHMCTYVCVADGYIGASVCRVYVRLFICVYKYMHQHTHSVCVHKQACVCGYTCVSVCLRM